MIKLQKAYPSYEGDEPYIYFAFAEADRRKAEKILRILFRRGCRVWYCTGPAGNSEELLRRQRRSCMAELTVLYLSDPACADTDTKNNVLVNQSAGRSILCLDPDGEDRGLMMGLYENIPHIPLYKLRSNDDIESAIVHAEGFSQNMIGKPLNIGGNSIGKLSLLLCALAAILAVVCFACYLSPARYSEDVPDEVEIGDPVIFSALKEASNGAAITEDMLSQLTFLRLSGFPQNWDDLELMPSLERISIPQQALLEADALPECSYTIELSGGLS